MAKTPKKKADNSPRSGGVFSHEAEQALISYLIKMPEMDEVLKKAGIQRHKLKNMLFDDEIYQAVEKRQDKLESSTFRLEPADTPAAEILSAHLREWWSDIVLSAQNARWQGYSVIEAVYRPDAYDFDSKSNFIGWQWVGEKPMQWYEPHSDGRLMLLSAYNNTNRDLEVDQAYKHFLTRCKPTYENPKGEALLSRLYWVWFFKTNSFKFWAKFVERFGNPLLLGKSLNVEAMKQALLNAHSSAVMSVDRMDDVQILSAQTNGGAQAFEGFDKRLERSIQKVILGQTLTSGTDGSGSRALGEVHLEVQVDKLRADIRMITPTVQAMLNALCDMNGWERHRIIIGEEKSLELPKAERDVKLKNAGANLTAQYFQREYGLQDGDVAEVTPQGDTKVAPTFTALPKQAFSFAATTKKLSPEQQELEELADEQKQFTLLDQKQLKELIADVETSEQLQTKLFGILGDVPVSQFSAVLDQALYAADVLGYVTASEGK